MVGIVHRDQIRSGFVPPNDPPQTSGERTPTVGKGNPQSGKLLKNPPKNHRTNGQGRFGGHPDEPGQPITVHFFLTDHIPGMHKDGGAQGLRMGVKAVKRRVVQIPLVDVRANLNTRQAQVLHTSFQFSASQVWVLHG